MRLRRKYGGGGWTEHCVGSKGLIVNWLYTAALYDWIRDCQRPVSRSMTKPLLRAVPVRAILPLSVNVFTLCWTAWVGQLTVTTTVTHRPHLVGFRFLDQELILFFFLFGDLFKNSLRFRRFESDWTKFGRIVLQLNTHRLKKWGMFGEFWDTLTATLEAHRTHRPLNNWGARHLMPDTEHLPIHH